ncbi:MAG: hypothetical protein HYV63_16335 [Candidatus Schekmanbacteria bacterium]|nr:hypothetical protein [Candidatus Schekmanbacteria bacterium]
MNPLSTPDTWIDAIGLPAFNDLRRCDELLADDARRRLRAALGTWMPEIGIPVPKPYQPLNPTEYRPELSGGQSIAELHPKSSMLLAAPRQGRPQAVLLGRLFHRLSASAIGAAALNPVTEDAALFGQLCWYLYRMEAVFTDLFEWESALASRRLAALQPALAREGRRPQAPGVDVPRPGKLGISDPGEVGRRVEALLAAMDSPAEQGLAYLLTVEDRGELAPAMHLLLAKPAFLGRGRPPVSSRSGVAAWLSHAVRNAMGRSAGALGLALKYGWTIAAAPEELAASRETDQPGQPSTTSVPDPRGDSPSLLALAHAELCGPEQLAAERLRFCSGNRCPQRLWGYEDGELMRFARRVARLTYDDIAGDALAIADGLLCLRPDEPYFWHVAAAAAAAAGEPGRAVRLYWGAVERNPHDLASASALTELFLRQGMLDPAIALLERLSQVAAGSFQGLDVRHQAINRTRLLAGLLVTHPWR